jgi:RND superfamily putative drug exporter
MDRTGRWLAGLTRWVLAHKRLVAVGWLVLTLAGFYGATQVTDALTEDFTMPESASTVTNERIVSRFDSGGATPPLVAVVTLPPGTTASAPAVRADLRALEQDLARAVPGARIASFGSTPEPAYVSDDGRTTFAIVHPPSAAVDDGGPSGNEINDATLARAEQAAAGARVGGAEVRLTGNALLTSEAPGESGPAFLNETLLAGVGALIVLVFVFASALALVPLLMAIVAIPVTLLAVWGLTALTEVNFVVVFLVSLIGLGVAIDYALLMIFRFRDELREGNDVESALAETMTHAGHSVIVSGTTVAVGLLSMVVLPLPLLRSMGIGGMLIPVVSVLASLTLLPAMLAVLGERINRVRVMPRRFIDRGHPEDGAWGRWARFVLRRPVAVGSVGLVIVAGLVGLGTQLNANVSELRYFPGAGTAIAGRDTLAAAGISPGVMKPLNVLVEHGDSAQRVAAKLREVPGLLGATAPSAWHRGQSSLVEAFPAIDGAAPGIQGVVDRTNAALEGTDATVTGTAAIDRDFLHALYGSFPYALALVLLLTLVLLTRAFRSLVLAVKAVLLNLVSLAAAFGIVVFVFQQGHGSSLWGIEATQSITAYIPVMIFAFLFGLSMDYEVFMLTRMREAYDETGSTDKAIELGLARTGKLVTSAALILMFAFLVLSSSPGYEIKSLAIGLAAGIIFDATVIRALLVPALMKLLGDANWWIPRWTATVLRIPHAERAPEVAAESPA